jgi:hypothetical protein
VIAGHGTVAQVISVSPSGWYTITSAAPSKTQ